MSSEESKRGSMKSAGLDSTSSGHCSLLAVDHKNFKTLWNDEVYQNRERWKAQAAKGTRPAALRRVICSRMGSDPSLVSGATFAEDPLAWLISSSGRVQLNTL